MTESTNTTDSSISSTSQSAGLTDFNKIKSDISEIYTKIDIFSTKLKEIDEMRQILNVLKGMSENELLKLKELLNISDIFKDLEHTKLVFGGIN